MKQLFHFTITLLLLSPLIGCLACAPKPSDPVQDAFDLLAKKKDSPVFEDILSSKVKDTDSEVDYVIKAKKSIDVACLQLMQLSDSFANEDDFSDVTSFTKAILNSQSVNNKLMDAFTTFGEHVQYLKDYSNNKSDEGYDKVKQVLLANDSTFSESQVAVFAGLSDYYESQKGFSEVLEGILQSVSAKDMETAGQLLKDERMTSYIVTAAKTMVTLYDFEVGRAESIIDAFRLFDSQ